MKGLFTLHSSLCTYSDYTVGFFSIERPDHVIGSAAIQLTAVQRADAGFIAGAVADQLARRGPSRATARLFAGKLSDAEICLAAAAGSQEPEARSQEEQP